MPTLSEFAQEYAEYIRDNRGSPTIANDVAKKIADLTYTKTGQPLNETDRDALIKQIQETLVPTKEADSGRIVEAEDSRSFIVMIQKIRELAKRK
jgi:hypothetical protein